MQKIAKAIRGQAKLIITCDDYAVAATNKKTIVPKIGKAILPVISQPVSKKEI